MFAFKKQKKNQDSSGAFMAKRRQILNKNSNFMVREAYKSLRTNIRFLLHKDGCKKICVVSGTPGEGKSITTLNLAISLAETGQRVLLIDADMRLPTQARLLMEKASPGLSNILAGLCSPGEAIRKSSYPGLDMIFAGDIPPNPSELLGNPDMKELLDSQSSEYDYILVDTPPVGVVTDACVLAPHLDGVLLLVRQGHAKKEEVRQSVRKLQMAGARILGYVFNAVPTERSSAYSYYYYGDQPDEKSEKNEEKP